MSPRDDRVLNPHGRRHYRRRYSLTEARIGALVLAGLAAVASYIAYAGAHPGPERAVSEHLPQGTANIERAPLPEALAAPGFREGVVKHFGADTLYEKINGRAGYFTSRGFAKLSFVPLASEKDPARAVDVELYDMSSPDNALGAYQGEKSASLSSERGAAGLWHQDGNALYMTHGRFYVRAIGSEASEPISAQLLHLKQALEAGLPSEGAELPWAHRVFGTLDVPAGRVAFHRENAFSFGFARAVYAALLPDDATELFVTAAADDAAAGALAEQFLEGFASLGEVETLGEQKWVKDRYLASYSTARAIGPLVVGVRSAPEAAIATAELGRIEATVRALPPEDVQAAVKATLAGMAHAPASPTTYGSGSEGAAAPEPVEEEIR